MSVLFQGLNSLVFLAIGVYCSIATQAAARGVGIAFSAPEGVTDFRATYGGMCLALGAFFGLAAAGKGVTMPAAHTAALLTYACLFLTRLYGMLTDGGTSSLMISFAAIEAVLSGVAAWLLFFR